MRRLRRARRPLVALLALVAALVIGYAVRGCASTGANRSDCAVAGCAPARPAAGLDVAPARVPHT